MPDCGDSIVAHDGGVGQQPEQAHLGDPAEEQVVRLLVEPVSRDRIVDVPSPHRGQPDADIDQITVASTVRRPQLRTQRLCRRW